MRSFALLLSLALSIPIAAQAQSTKIDGALVELQPFPTTCDVFWSETPSHSIRYGNSHTNTSTVQITQGSPVADGSPTDLFAGIRNMAGVDPYVVLVGDAAQGVGLEWDFMTPRNDVQLAWATPDAREAVSLWDANGMLVSKVTGGAVVRKLTGGAKVAQVNVHIHSDVPFTSVVFGSHIKGFEFSDARFDALPQCPAVPQ